MEQADGTRSSWQTSGTESLQEAKKHIVFLECLVEQIKAANERSRHEGAQTRELLQEIQQREVALGTRLESLQTELNHKTRQNTDLLNRLESLERKVSRAKAQASCESGQAATSVEELDRQMDQERRKSAQLALWLEDARSRVVSLEDAQQGMFQKILQWQGQIQAGDTDAMNLAEFIAGMRSEVISLQHLLKKSEAREAHLAQGLDPSSQDASHTARPTQAACLNPEVPDAAEDLGTVLQHLDPSACRPLAARLIAQLESPAATDSRRAAARLVEVLGVGAGPYLAAAATASEDPVHRSHLVHQLGRIADAQVLTVAEGFLGDPAAEVRAAALDAYARLAGRQAGKLEAVCDRCLKDEDGRIRRRAMVHLAALPAVDPGPRCDRLLQDPDPRTRRAASACLAGTRDPQAAMSLLRATLDEDQAVRRTAVEAASRVFGQQLDASLPGPQLRRRAAVEAMCAYLSASLSRLAPGDRLLPANELAGQLPSAMWRGAPAQLAESASAPELDAGVERVRQILRTHMSGCTLSQLATELGCDVTELSLELDAYKQAGQVMQRGKKLFTS